MNSAIWLRNPVAVFTDPSVDASGGIVVRDDSIIEIVSSGCTPKNEWQESVDLSDSVILPGLINTHHHFYQTLTRCVPQALNKPLFPWLTTLYQIWQHLDAEMLAAATEVAGLELMLSGATTITDHHYVFPRGLENAIDVQVEVVRQMGCRAVLTRGSMSLGKEDGGLPPDSVIQDEDTIMADCERVIDEFHEAYAGAMIQIALAPCSPFSVTQALMSASAELAIQKNVLLHTHLAETEDENAFCLREFGLRPVDYLEQCNWVNDRTWLAHGIHFNADEIIRLGEAGVGIAHCPTSNMLLGSGICPAVDLIDAGCRFGLAVDGSASNDGSNMIQEVRHSLLQQRLRYRPEQITAETVLRWASKGSASLLQRDDIGEIAVGQKADLAIFDLNELRFSGSGDPIAALVVCGAHAVNRLMIGGKWVIENNEHRAYVAGELLEKHSKLAEKLQSYQ